MVRKDLGMVTAYAYAVSKGYTGTEAEFAELMASYATVAEAADASAQAAASSASSAAGSATNASGSASAAAGSASAAANSASTASTKASESATSATAAAGSATTASTKAGEAASSASAAAQSATQAAGSASSAAQSATDANTAKTDAQTAKTAAETAQEKAEEAQAAAEAAAQTFVIDDTLTQENQAAEAKAVGDALKTKAEIDGYYQDMTVGDAEQLVSSQYVEDNVPYKFRTSGGSADVGNREYADKIVGGTIAWNQLVANGRGDNITGWSARNGTLEQVDDYFRATATQAGNGMGLQGGGAGNKQYTIAGHKYMLMATVRCPSANTLAISFSGGNGRSYTVSQANVWTVIGRAWTYQSDIPTGSIYCLASGVAVGDVFDFKNVMAMDLTQMFGSAIADAIYAMDSANAGAGLQWFKSLFPEDYYPGNEGELISVSGLQSHDMVGFNQWDEQWENGSYSITTGEKESGSSYIRSKNAIPVLPSTQYCTSIKPSGGLWFGFYDSNDAYLSYITTAGGVITTPANAYFMRFHTYGGYGTTYKNDICINLSHNGSRNGEYEPYAKHSYPLDSSLTLRGIPKLSADNHLYFDGDEYLPEGKVNRRYGIVDLGTLSWGKSGNALFFTTSLQSLIKKGTTAGGFDHIKCVKYVAQNVASSSALNDKCMSVDTSGNIQIIDTDYASSTVANYKAAMSGVMLVYELATPTEETAEPYSGIQLVNDWGTEEYVSGTICPVGHETRYPANLRDKLQHLPDLASADGYYVVQQTGSQMSLVHFRIPQAPSADGTYTLKATVSGGNPTYTWEVVT